MLLAQFQAVGRDLFQQGLISSHSGNLSIRMGDRIIITRRNCMLSSLEEADLIETGVEKNDRHTPLASSELCVHRAIYKATPAQAIVHAHPPHTVALSLVDRELVPSDMEGIDTLGTVPVLGWGMEVKPGGLPDVIAQAFAKQRIVIVRGHGTFAVGQLLEGAYSYTTTLEESARILCLLKSLNVAQVKTQEPR